MKSISMLMIVVSICVTGTAQNIATDVITWTGNTSLDLQSSSNIELVTTVTTHRKTSVDLSRDGETISFLVTTADTSWTDITHDGSAVFHVTYQNRPGIIYITRSADETAIVIDFTSSASDALKLKLFVDSFQVLP